MIKPINVLFGKKNRLRSIVSLEKMTLTLREMRGSRLYEAVCTGEKTELKLYRETFSNDKPVRVLERSAVCDSSELIGIMNKCGIAGWNGFHGKHPKRVADGTVFSFTATVNGGREIRADGSANFPKGYSEFTTALNGIL